VSICCTRSSRNAAPKSRERRGGGGTLELPAYGYLDAGTASVLLQVLAAGFFAVLFLGKTFWWKIKRVITYLAGRAHHNP